MLGKYFLTVIYSIRNLVTVTVEVILISPVQQEDQLLSILCKYLFSKGVIFFNIVANCTALCEMLGSSAGFWSSIVVIIMKTL